MKFLINWITPAPSDFIVVPPSGQNLYFSYTLSKGVKSRSTAMAIVMAVPEDAGVTGGQV